MFIKARNPKKQTNTTGVKTNKGVAVHLWIFIVGVATAHHVCICPGKLVREKTCYNAVIKPHTRWADVIIVVSFSGLDL